MRVVFLAAAVIGAARGVLRAQLLNKHVVADTPYSGSTGIAECAEQHDREWHFVMALHLFVLVPSVFAEQSHVCMLWRLFG